MAAVKSKNTAPEMTVRRLLFAEGYRYRLHTRKLPGKPDLVFPAQRKAIFVHGCFWHGHRCSKERLPKSNLDFWQAKIARNRQRDGENARAMKKLGWLVLVVWQCQLRHSARLLTQMMRFLDKSFPSTKRPTF